MTDLDAFRNFEVAGWEKKAEAYHTFFTPITSRVIEQLLDAARVGSGTKVLDVATGPGYVAARAAARGASVVGVDVARPMLALATKLHPGLQFRQADAEQLPFSANSFDAVVSNFVVPHLAYPERAAAELARVLAPGGRLALTMWDVANRSRLLGLFAEAIERVGAPEPAGLPPGPPFLHFSSDDEFAKLLQSARLQRIEVRRIAFTHRVPGPAELWNGVLGGGVRTSAFILGQTREIQERIRAAFDDLAQEYQKGDGLEIPISVKLASGDKTVTASVV